MSFNSDMTNLADAIRTKAGVTGGLTVSAMTTAVNGIVINAGSDIDLSGVNVTADKLLSGIVAVNADGEKVTGNIVTVTPSISANVFTVRKGYVAQDAELTVPEAAVTETDSSVTIGIGYVSEELTYDLGSGGSDIDFTGVNVTADQLLFGAVAIDADGSQVTGSLPYTQVALARNVIDIPRGVLDSDYHNEIQLVRPVFDEDRLTVSIREGYVYGEVVLDLEESEVISGDSAVTVTKGYVKEDFDIPTGGGSGSGAFDLAKVTEYTPYAQGVSAVTSVVVSGMGVIADEEDVTAANGTYLVTADTAAETDWKKRVYKHESADYYLYHYADPDYPEDAYWQFGYDTDSSFLTLYSSEDIASGENDWHSEDWGEDFTLTLDVMTATTPEQPLVLKGVKATGYTDGEWSFADSEQNFTGFETTPKKSCVYAVSGNKLFGSAVDLAGMYPGDAILSNCDSLTDTYMRYTNCELSTSVKKFGSGSIKINSNGYIKFNHGKTSLVNIPWTAAHFFYADSYTGGTDLKPLINNDTDAGGTFFIAITSGGKIRTHIRGGSYSDTQDTLSSGWHHIRAVQYGGTLKAYLDGNLIATVTTFSANTDSLWIGKLAAASSRQFEGYIDGIEFFEIPANRLDLYTGDTAPVPDKEFEI